MCFLEDDDDDDYDDDDDDDDDDDTKPLGVMRILHVPTVQLQP